MKAFLAGCLLSAQLYVPSLLADQSYRVIFSEAMTDKNKPELFTHLLLHAFEKTYVIMKDKKLLDTHRYAKKISFDQERFILNVPESIDAQEFFRIFKTVSKQEGPFVNFIPCDNHDLPTFEPSGQQLLWHHTVKTTGLYELNNKDKASFYLPHQFSLWQLAPKKGRGATIAFIDTGFALPENVWAGSGNDLLHTYKTDKNYNFINNNPYLKFITFVKTLLKNHKSFHTIDVNQLEAVCIKSIYDYLENKSISRLISYLNQHSCQIDQQTQEALKKPLEQFHLIKLSAGSKHEKKFLKELLPITIIDPLKTTTELTHGLHVVGVAASKVSGIAPEASVIMIKAFDQEGHSTRSTIIQALNATLEHRPLIINISYKISDFIDQASSYAATLQTLIDLIPYCVASSGNDGHTGLYGQGYPARFESVAFDVGAFAYNHTFNTYPVPLFSQYELDQGFCIGPKFLAPGYNIVCSDYQKNSYMQGTSMAAPIISGFVALMLAEFPDDQDFTREHLLKVCYSSGIFLADNHDWKTKSVFGALDFRTVLFVLHVLRTFKKLSLKTESIFFNQFDQLVSTINSLLQTMATERKSADLTDLIFADLTEAITFVANCLLFITNQSTNKPVQLSSSLEKSMKENMKKLDNLFSQYPPVVQTKIQNVLSSDNALKKSHRMVKNYLGQWEFAKFLNNMQWYEKYWKQQISKKEKVHS